MNKLKFFQFIILLISLLGNRVSAQQNEISTTSPDKNLNISLRIKDEGEKNGVLVYSVDYKGKPVILESELGLMGSAKWTESFTIKEVRTNSKDTTWHPVYGERSVYRDHYNESVIVLNQSGKEAVLELVVRAYNEGIAFRYFFPEKPTGGTYLRIMNESTGFSFSDGTKAWVTVTAQGVYSLQPLKAWTTEYERPLTLELQNGLYASLAEAEMVDYSRTKFILDANKPNTVKCAMYDSVDSFTPFSTPWRVIMVAEKPGQLVENNFILLNLNPPCQIAQTDWIKPGKIMRETTLSAKGAKDMVDFAVKHRLKYIHFDAGWYGFEYVVGSDATKVKVDPRRNPNSDLDLQEVIRYAKEKGIGVFLYVNQRALYRQLDEILPLYWQWGVAGIKFGFVEVGSHRWTTWLHEAVRKCAKNGLMVDIHDEYRPTGFSRTYPNLLTQEGIRGNEEMPPATNSTVQPFTRFLAGPADHTICYYQQRGLKPGQNVPDNRYINTTSGHQLALSVIFYSPLQFLYWYDKPSDVQDEPELEFFDQVPVVWDDTKVLDGKIGEYISVARRSGEEWFIGSVTNTDARSLKLSLDFLPEGKRFEANIYSDDATVHTRTKVGIRRITVDSKTIFDVNLKASGGQAIHIVPQQKVLGQNKVAGVERSVFEIYTPKPGPKPRINGPLVYGARPGNPFLYRIPCQGERPIKFSVKGLPGGLNLDPSTGIISGQTPVKGEYSLIITAENPKGRDKRAFKIVAGDMLALTPPMGWNSWYVHFNRVTENHLRSAADAMISSGMADVGYQYVNIDDCWMNADKTNKYMPDSTRLGPVRDSDGNILPNKHFPEMKAMTDYIHSKGLKAGIYSSPGPNTCCGLSGSWQHEEQDARQFSSWGFDFLKYDWCSYSRIAGKEPSLEEMKKPFSLMGEALRSQPRDMVYNLCQYGMGNVWEWGNKVGGNCWRTAGDLGFELDRFFHVAIKNAEHGAWSKPGSWNDPDYLQIGWIGAQKGTTFTPAAPCQLSANEQYSYMSLWCLMAAPLFFSGDMSKLDEFTLNVLSNPEIIEVDQDALGKCGVVIRKTDTQFIMYKLLQDGSLAIGLFNQGKRASEVVLNWEDLKISGKHSFRDLWRHKELGIFDEKFSSTIPANGVVMIKITKTNR